VQRIIIVTLILLGTISVMYFSWLADPDIGKQSYFPGWLGQWTNKNGNLRTAVPFLFLGTLLEYEFVKHDDPRKMRRILLASLVVIVVIAELGQLFLAKRHFDPLDIMWGFLGSVTGMFAGYTAKRLFAVK